MCHVLHMTEPQGMTCFGLCGQYLCDAVTAGVLQELSCLLRLRPALLCCSHPLSPGLYASLSFHHAAAHQTHTWMRSTFQMEGLQLAHAVMLQG